VVKIVFALFFRTKNKQDFFAISYTFANIEKQNNENFFL